MLSTIVEKTLEGIDHKRGVGCKIDNGSRFDFSLINRLDVYELGAGFAYPLDKSPVEVGKKLAELLKGLDLDAVTRSRFVVFLSNQQEMRLDHRTVPLREQRFYETKHRSVNHSENQYQHAKLMEDIAEQIYGLRLSIGDIEEAFKRPDLDYSKGVSLNGVKYSNGEPQKRICESSMLQDAGKLSTKPFIEFLENMPEAVEKVGIQIVGANSDLKLSIGYDSVHKKNAISYHQEQWYEDLDKANESMDRFWPFAHELTNISLEDVSDAFAESKKQWDEWYKKQAESD